MNCVYSLCFGVTFRRVLEFSSPTKILSTLCRTILMIFCQKYVYSVFLMVGWCGGHCRGKNTSNCSCVGIDRNISFPSTNHQSASSTSAETSWECGTRDSLLPEEGGVFGFCRKIEGVWCRCVIWQIKTIENLCGMWKLGWRWAKSIICWKSVSISSISATLWRSHQ